MSAPAGYAVRVLPPDVYDALELSAFVYRGIGRGQYHDADGPCCVIGHAARLGVGFDSELYNALRNAGIGEKSNDEAVAPDLRIPFAEWCRRLNVVRADVPTFDPANFPPARASKRRGER